MKNSILLLLFLLLALFFGNAQEFAITENYMFNNQRVFGQEEEGAVLVDIVRTADWSRTLATLAITELELLEDVRIAVLSDPGLEDVREVLKIELEYIACCANTETYYFLVNRENDFTALPKIDNLYCDAVESDEHYVFPNEAYGREGAILRAELWYAETNTIEEIEVLQSIVWNDDDFDYEDAITAIND